MTDQAFHRQQAELLPQQPAPATTVGIVGWARTNLFSGWFNSVVTLIAIYILWLIVSSLVQWAFIGADVSGTDRFACTSDGACWAWIDQRIQQFLYGFYPAGETWRINLAFVLLFPALAPWMFDNVPGARYLRWFSIAYPVIATILLAGGLGLTVVTTDKFGGFMLNLTVGLAGIVLSLPFGIILALGRQSRLPIIRILSIIFIEAVRGVPLITLLFVSNIILPIFLPPDVALDSVIRVIVMVTAFASAYMAEVIRGGLQAIPKGQYEAAQAMGLGYWQMMGLIVMPQALKHMIPNIVGNFIGLLKDTTLVSIIGLFDILHMIKAASLDVPWRGLHKEPLLFGAIIFFVLCFAMSKYSRHLEVKLSAGDQR